MRSAPTSFGLSYRMGMPLLVPGPSTTQGTSENQRVAICRSSVVTWGTDELTAMPVTEGAMSRPSRSSSWVRSTACSSGVRVGTVERRQWCVRPTGALGSRSVPIPAPTPCSMTGTESVSSPVYRPMTVSVLPTSMTRSTLVLQRSLAFSLVPGSGPNQVEAQIEYGGRVRQRTHRNPVGARCRVGADGGQGHAARHLREDTARRTEVGHGDGLLHLRRVH